MSQVEPGLDRHARVEVVEGREVARRLLGSVQLQQRLAELEAEYLMRPSAHTDFGHTSQRVGQLSGA